MTISVKVTYKNKLINIFLKILSFCFYFYRIDNYTTFFAVLSIMGLPPPIVRM